MQKKILKFDPESRLQVLRHPSLLGDVVLDSFNTVHRDKDSILDQTYQKQICSYLYYDDLIYITL